MIGTGSHTWLVDKNTRIRIMTDAYFRLYGYKDGEVKRLYGPINADARSIVVVTDPEDDEMRLKFYDQTAMWQIEEDQLPDGKEYPDPTPVEIGIPAPLTLREEMRRFIREEVSRSAMDAGQTTFEEEDDFDVSDDELPISKYEFVELQDDYDPGYNPDSEPPSPAEQGEAPLTGKESNEDPHLESDTNVQKTLQKDSEPIPPQ